MEPSRVAKTAAWPQNVVAMGDTSVGKPAWANGSGQVKRDKQESIVGCICRYGKNEDDIGDAK